MATSKQDRKMARKFKNPVSAQFNTARRAISGMDKRRDVDSRKNKSWQDAI